MVQIGDIVTEYETKRVLFWTKRIPIRKVVTESMGISSKGPPTRAGSEGELWFDKDAELMKMFCRGKWVEVVAPSVLNSLPTQTKVNQPSNCKNCGASLTGSQCEYCHTRY